MKRTHTTKRVYSVRCKSGLTGWRIRLRNNYKSYEEWVDWSELRGLASRLGYESEEAAWKANPVVEGSVNPSDFRRSIPKSTKS